MNAHLIHYLQFLKVKVTIVFILVLTLPKKFGRKLSI